MAEFPLGLVESSHRRLFAAVLYRLVDHDRRGGHLPVPGADEPRLPHMWCLLHLSVLHVSVRVRDLKTARRAGAKPARFLAVCVCARVVPCCVVRLMTQLFDVFV